MIVERVTLASPAELGETVARRLAARMAAAAASSAFWCALTGGSAARLVHPALVQAGVDWTRVNLLFGDERGVPPGHADSNYRLAKETLLDPAKVPPARVHRMRGEADDLEGAARDYDKLLPAAIDVVLLGMGPDGHICSLFPGHPLLGEPKLRVAALTDSPKLPPRRLTLTLVTLAAARECWFVVAGADKAAAVTALSDAASELPAALVARGPASVRVFVDAAAGGST